MGTGSLADTLLMKVLILSWCFSQNWWTVSGNGMLWPVALLTPVAVLLAAECVLVVVAALPGRDFNFVSDSDGLRSIEKDLIDIVECAMPRGQE